MFAVDSLPGVGELDNLGIPESGDGISDILQEAKWEADFLAKMQDADGGFYYSVYPMDREYERQRVARKRRPASRLAEKYGVHRRRCRRAGGMRLIAALQAGVSANGEPIIGPRRSSGWQFLTNAIAQHGLDGAYQKIQHFGDIFTDRDELAWAACEMFLATGDTQYRDKLFEWYPDPTDPATFRWGWWRMYSSLWQCGARLLLRGPERPTYKRSNGFQLPRQVRHRDHQLRQ